MLVRGLLQAPQKKRKRVIWTPLNPVNTRKWNGCIKAYKSHLFLDSLTSGNEQGLKVLSLPAKVLDAFSLSAESIKEEEVETRESASRSDFAKRDPSLAQLRRQTDRQTCARTPAGVWSSICSTLIPNPLLLQPSPWDRPESRARTQQHASRGYKAVSTGSREVTAPPITAQSTWWMRITVDIWSPTVTMESNGGTPKLRVVQEIKVNYLNDFA